MPDRTRLRRPSTATAAAAAMALLLLLGGLVTYAALLRGHDELAAAIPGPVQAGAPLYTVPAHAQACMSAVTVTPQSRTAVITLFPAPGARHGGPPVALTLNGPGYRSTTDLSGGYPGGLATLPLTAPPRQSVLVTACFVDRGQAPVRLAGGNQPHTVTRSNPVTVAGQPQPGDISLRFDDNPAQGLRYRVTQAVDHASAMTDGLLPPALIWIVGAVTFLGVPAMAVLAWRRAVADD